VAVALLCLYPAHTACRSTLQVLCLQHNSIRHIPRELGLLKHLETIDLSYNQLEDLPIELSQLPLKVLSLRECACAIAAPLAMLTSSVCPHRHHSIRSST
jgi:Leucine-rich repeat (LRR) protein